MLEHPFRGEILRIPEFIFDRELADLCGRIDDLLSVLEGIPSRGIVRSLRRSARIRSVRSSLAIEGNGLTESQIRDVIRGGSVQGPFDEVVEARNAAAAYALIGKVDVFSVECFLKVESVMMWGLTEHEGYRTGQVVISDGTTIYYTPPRAEDVPRMVDELFAWCSQSGHPMYLIAAVAHYYIESIHPFPDGNGRMGRFWHTAMLIRQSKAFRMISMENSIVGRQQEYYDVLERCQRKEDCTEFLKFMLELTVSLLEDLERLQDPYIFELLSAMGDAPMTATEILRRMRMSDRGNLQKMYLRPAIECGFVRMTEPDHPHSPTQRYVKLLR